jgi:hypothetical protein
MTGIAGHRKKIAAQLRQLHCILPQQFFDLLLFTGQEFDHLLNALLSALDYFEVWEERLSAAAESHAPLKTFIALGEEVMGDFFVICDMETNLLASSKVDPKDIEGTTWEYFFAHGRVSPTSMNNPITDDRGEQITGAHAYPRLISRPSAARTFSRSARDRNRWTIVPRHAPRFSGGGIMKAGYRPASYRRSAAEKRSGSRFPSGVSSGSSSPRISFSAFRMIDETDF